MSRPFTSDHQNVRSSASLCFYSAEAASGNGGVGSLETQTPAAISLESTEKQIQGSLSLDTLSFTKHVEEARLAEACAMPC
eukprot:95358-Rhodomonas_salina.4